MTHADSNQREARGGWEHIGRAAEDFARRVARDATKFAERMEEHAGDFARDAARDWRRAERDLRRGCQRAWRVSEPEVRRVFEDVRTVIVDVLEGVDELIAGIFQEPPRADTHASDPSATPRADTADGWVRIVHNRDAVCSGCDRTIAAGDEGYVCHTDERVAFRCLDCGPPVTG